MVMVLLVLLVNILKKFNYNWAASYLESFSTVVVCVRAPAVKRNPNAAHWKLPPTIFWKLNSNASVHAELGCYGLGGVIRGYFGILWLDILYVSRRVDVLTAKALALLHGLQLSVELDCLHICIESDCLSLTSSIQEGHVPHKNSGSIILDILDVSSHFSAFSFLHIPRSCNGVTHHLASLGPSSGSNSR